MGLRCTGVEHYKSTRSVRRRCHHGVPSQETVIGHTLGTLDVPVWDIAKGLLGETVVYLTEDIVWEQDRTF
jgi:hypothetical protein